MKLFIGIDPGESGAIAFLDKYGAKVFDMPTDISGIDKLALTKMFFDEIENYTEVVIMIEKQGVQGTKTGVKAAFTSGRNYEKLLSVVEMLTFNNNPKVSIRFVDPKTWKKSMKLELHAKAPQSAKKRLTAKRCEELGYRHLIYGIRGGLKDGRSDALMIAEYCRRLING